MNKLNNKKGISLIVLVITIIVMIILAAAIILSLQSSGIIGRANEASSKSDESNMIQAANVAYGEYLLERNLGQTNVEAEEYVKDKLSSNFNQEELKKLSVLSDGTIQILPTIPTGFTLSIYEGEQKISEGLVVYETTAETLASKSQEEAMTTFNQYVWIPVEENFERVNWQNEDNFKNSYKEPYEDGYDTEVEEYEKMKASVEKNGGFYIARYEAGKGENNTVVSKKGAKVWNYIAWGTSMTAIEEAGAVYLSKSLYPETETSNIVSTLCYGVQWDAVMNFMKDVPNPNVPGKKYIDDSTGMGWFVDNYEEGNLECKTGIDVGENASNKVKNIYDMAGNMEEWTMEADLPDFRVFRGGSYGCSGEDYPASNRYSLYPDDWGLDSLGFRPTLYLK